MYSVLIYPDISLTGTPLVIPSSSVFALDLGGNRFSNNNPFEVVGNQARVSIINEASYWTQLSQAELYEVIRLGKVVNSSYFNRLVQIKSEQTGVIEFTGLIRATDLELNYVNDTIDITVSDSLYIYVDLLRSLQTYNIEVKKSNLLANLMTPLCYKCVSEYAISHKRTVSGCIYRIYSN